MRPVPTLPPELKTVATVVSKTASTILIVFVALTLGLFLIMRIFTVDRVIQMNMEIGLIAAHLFLLYPPEISEDVVRSSSQFQLLLQILTLTLTSTILKYYHN